MSKLKPMLFAIMTGMMAISVASCKKEQKVVRYWDDYFHADSLTEQWAEQY